MPAMVSAKKNAATPTSIAKIGEVTTSVTDKIIKVVMIVPSAPVSNSPKFSQTQSLSV